MRNLDNPYSNPIVFENQQQEQIYVNGLKTNRETFYFVEYNYVETNDNRVNFLNPPKTYAFLTTSTKPGLNILS